MNETMSQCQATDAQQACDALQPSGAFHQDCGPDASCDELRIKDNCKTMVKVAMS